MIVAILVLGGAAALILVVSWHVDRQNAKDQKIRDWFDRHHGDA